MLHLVTYWGTFINRLRAGMSNREVEATPRRRHEIRGASDDAVAVSYIELRAMPPKVLRERLTKSPMAAARLIKAGARYGFPEAQLVLGQMLLDGIGVDRDRPSAIRWFRRAAEAGSGSGAR